MGYHVFYDYWYGHFPEFASVYLPSIKGLKDWIAKSKSNGYTIHGIIKGGVSINPLDPLEILTGGTNED